jgi:hypothetical protein
MENIQYASCYLVILTQDIGEDIIMKTNLAELFPDAYFVLFI